ncbi:unnamed protein product [Cuscuta campestris]|uniref:Uncharacterized protein n=1 Tax=Cuscuta campestris TaxID=132261 RepID=A0A484KLD0_9ASTE|nr:unnamed protein product [Cuscuta campestris]
MTSDSNSTASSSPIRMSASKHFPIKLTKSNYLVWRRQVQTTLVGLDLLGYVDGTLKMPPPFLDAAHKQPNPAYTSWYRQDAIILSAILGSCTDLVQPLISLAETAADAWSRLAKNLANASRGRIISLKSQLAKNPRGNRTIEAFISDMTTIASDLALAGSPVSDEDLSVHIMSQLGEDYSSLYQSLRGCNADVSIDELTTILKDCEREILARSAVSADLVPTANHAQRMRNSDRGGGSTRHGSSGVPRGGLRGRGNFNPSRGGRYCQFCDLASHDTRFCRKLQRFLRDNNVTIAPSRPDGPAAHVTVSNDSTGQPIPPWIVDSGASHHVSNDPASLTSLMEYGGPDEIRLGNALDSFPDVLGSPCL